MTQTNFNLGKTVNSAGKSEIGLRLYVSRDVRIRIGSGIWADRKHWGKKNDTNIPLIQGDEREILLEKHTKLKALTDYLENIINTCEDKSTINWELIEKEIKRFYKPVRRDTTSKWFSISEKYPDCKSFSHTIRPLCNIYTKSEATVPGRFLSFFSTETKGVHVQNHHHPCYEVHNPHNVISQFNIYIGYILVRL